MMMTMMMTVVLWCECVSVRRQQRYQPLNVLFSLNRLRDTQDTNKITLQAQRSISPLTKTK